MTHSERVGLIVCLIVVCLLVAAQGFYDFHKAQQLKADSAIISLEIVEQNRADSLAYKKKQDEKHENKMRRDSLKRVTIKKKRTNNKPSGNREKVYRDFSKEPID